MNKSGDMLECRFLALEQYSTVASGLDIIADAFSMILGNASEGKGSSTPHERQSSRQAAARAA
jgi:hypothetical protein